MFTMALGITGCDAMKNQQNNTAGSQDVIHKLLSADAEQIPVEEHEFVGLSDVSAVGVNGTRFQTEEVLSIKESDFDTVLNAADYGVVADDGKDDSLAVMRAVAAVKSAAVEGKSVLLKLPKGELDFVESLNETDRTCAVLLSGLKNVTLLGDETLFTIHGATVGIKALDCENLAIKGISYDYGRTPFSVGDVTASTENSVTVQFRDHYPITPETNFNDYLEYDKFSYVPRANGNFMLKSDITNVAIDGQSVTFTFSGAINKPVNGTLVVVSHYTYSYNAFQINDCKDVALENIDVYATAGMGLVLETTENATINRFNVRLKPNTDRLMSATADGLHLAACRGEVKITNCLVENTHDDAFNIKSGHYYNVGQINREENTLKCATINYMHAVKAGDKLNVYEKNLKFVTQIEVAETLSADGTGTVVRIKDAIPAAVTSDHIIANASSAPSVVFENNVIRNKRNRGILLQTEHAILRNNAFFNVGHGAISITTEAAQFNEAIVPQDILIESNKIVGCNSMGGGVGGDINLTAYGQNWTAAPAGAMKNITVCNNFIGNTSKRAIGITSAAEVTIADNCIYNPARRPVTKQNDCAISLSESSDLTIQRNYVSNNSASKDYVSLYTDGTVDEAAVALSDNVGLAFVTVDESVTPDNVYRLPQGAVVDMTAENFNGFENVQESIRFVGYTDAYGKETRPISTDFAIKMFKVAYNEEGIYIAFDILDDKLEFSSSSSFWTGDGFEIFFTPATEENYAFPIIRQEHDDTAQLYLTPSYLHVESSRTSTYLQENKAQAFASQCWKTSDGYAGKLFIDFSVCKELKQIAEEGGIASFSFVFADMETGDDRLQVSNTAHNVETKKGIPVQMGKIKFVKGEESNENDA